MVAADTSPALDPAQAAAILATPLGRRAMSEVSPTYFDTHYCGMREAAHRTKWLDTIEAAMLRARKTRDKARIKLLAPRKHGKTETVISITARQVCLDRNIRILWISAAAGTAKKRIKRFRSLLESDKFKADWESAPEMGYGPFRAKDAQGNYPKWTENQLYLTRTIPSTDPTVEAVGTGGKITGGHFDLIICDDLEDDLTTNSVGQRKKTRNWWSGTILPMLNPGGTLLVVGTRKHHDDLYAHLKAPSWVEIEDPAIIGEIPEHKILTAWDPETQQDRISGVEVKGPYKVLWPEERGIEYLLKERHEMGPQIFAREFQHKVLDDSAAAYRMEWFEAAKARGRNLNLRLGELPPDLINKRPVVVTGWDLALVDDPDKAKAQDSDYVVGITVARDPENGDHYLLGIYRRRGMTPAAIQGAVKGQFEMFGGTGRVNSVVVERNAFGSIHYMGLQRSTDLPLKPHMTTGRGKADPWDGVSSMGSQFENGKWIFPYHDDDPVGRALVDVLVSEMHGLGSEAHDDCAMAFWIACLGLRSSTFVYRVAVGDEEDAAQDPTSRAALNRALKATAQAPEDIEAAALWHGLHDVLHGQEYFEDDIDHLVGDDEDI